MRTLVTLEEGPTLLQYELISTGNTCSYFQMSSHSEVLGVRTPPISLGNIIQSVTDGTGRQGETGDRVSGPGIQLANVLPPLSGAEPCRGGSLPQHPDVGDKGLSAAIPVPVHGWIQALPLGPSPGDDHAVSVAGAPAEGPGPGGACSGLGGGVLMLASHGNTAAVPRASPTAVAVES